MKKFSLYGLFNSNRDDLNDLVAEEDTTPNLKRFFKLFGRKFWRLISLNLLMLPMVLPIFIAIFVYLGIDKTVSESSVLFPQLYGANVIGQSAETTFLLDLFGAQTMIPSYHSTGTYVAIGICALFLFITFGWQNVGATYLLRGIVRGEPTFFFSDYFYAIKKNLKQGFLLGALDFFALFLIGFDFMYFWGQTGSFGMDLMFFSVCAIGILYFFMRFYIYLLQITFNLSIRKIFKNALIFVPLGIKRNLMALLGIVLVTAVTVALAALFLPLNFAIPLILPFFYFLSFCSFMSAFAAYPVIEKYMITPYKNPETESDPPASANSQ